MLRYLILTIENSLGTAILLALIFMAPYAAYGVGRGPLRRWAPFGVAAGLAVALILSAVIHGTVLINREFLNIGILSVAIASGILFILTLWGLFGKMAPRVHSFAGAASAALLSASLLVYCLPTVILYPAQFRLAGESVFSTDFLFKSIGYLAGLLIVFLAALALFRVRRGISGSLLRVLLTAALAVNMLDQFSTIVQFLLARRIIPMSKGVFEFVKLTVNYDNYFLYIIMAITLPLPFLLWAANLRPAGEWENPAQHRKIKSAARGIRRWSALILACYLLSVISVTAVKAYDGREVRLSPAEPMDADGVRAAIPIENINDGHLHRFAYISSEGIEVRFIVIKKNESAWGVGLDACDICGATGYYEREDEVICKLCDVVMNKATIGFKGGCNPVPLAYEVSNGNIIIKIQDLENEQHRFK
jgi:uncharacterized membrane protein